MAGQCVCFVRYMQYHFLAHSRASLLRSIIFKALNFSRNASSISSIGRSLICFNLMAARLLHRNDWAQLFSRWNPLALARLDIPTLRKCPGHSSLCCGQSAVWHLGPQYNFVLQALQWWVPGWSHPGCPHCGFCGLLQWSSCFLCWNALYIEWTPKMIIDQSSILLFSVFSWWFRHYLSHFCLLLYTFLHSSSRNSIFPSKNDPKHAFHRFLQLVIFHRSSCKSLALSTSTWVQIMVQCSKDHDSTNTYIRSSNVWRSRSDIQRDWTIAKIERRISCIDCYSKRTTSRRRKVIGTIGSRIWWWDFSD